MISDGGVGGGDCSGNEGRKGKRRGLLWADNVVKR